MEPEFDKGQCEKYPDRLRSGSDAIGHNMIRERKKAHAYEILMKVIPWELISREDDKVLQQFFDSM